MREGKVEVNQNWCFGRHGYAACCSVHNVVIVYLLSKCLKILTIVGSLYPKPLTSQLPWMKGEVVAPQVLKWMPWCKRRFQLTCLTYLCCMSWCKRKKTHVYVDGYLFMSINNDFFFLWSMERGSPLQNLKVHETNLSVWMSWLKCKLL